MGVSSPISLTDDFSDCFERHNLRFIYHYTPIQNLSHIYQYGGLWSRHQLVEQQIEPQCWHGWGKKREVLKDYICCCLVAPQAMMKHHPEPMAACVLSPFVCAQSEALFCPINSARKIIAEEDILARVGVECLESLFEPMPGFFLRNTECEVMIPNHIPLNAIQSVMFADHTTRKQARQLFRARYSLWKTWKATRHWKLDDGSLFPF